MKKRLSQSVKKMNENFETFLLKEIEKYEDNTIVEAMKYCMEGGKRFRPRLIFSIIEGNGIEEEKAFPAAAAVEFIQTYSLIHDDLPAMDNDDFRRGKPSCHKKFGEDVAILTGDALLTHAFSCLSDNVSDFQATIRQISDLARYSGLEGMIKGQLLDIKAHELNPDVFTIQDNKTSGLFKYCCLSAMHLLNIDNREYFIELGSKIGIIFQHQDDLFDVIKSEAEMGKSLSDDKNDKLTALTGSSVEELEKKIDSLFIELDEYLKDAPFNSEGLKKLLYSMKTR